MESKTERNPNDNEMAGMQELGMITDLLARSVAMERLLIKAGVFTEEEFVKETLNVGVEMQKLMEERLREKMKSGQESQEKG